LKPNLPGENRKEKPGSNGEDKWKRFILLHFYS